MSSSCTAMMLHAVVRRSSVTRRSVATTAVVASKRCFSDAARVEQDVVVAANGGLSSWAQEEAEATAKRDAKTTPTAKTTSTPYTTQNSNPSKNMNQNTLDKAILEQHQNDDDVLDQVDMESLTKLASQACTPLRLLDMYRHASSVDPQQRLRNAQFLLHELPIRVAQRAVDLLTLPHGLNQTKPIQNVAKIYLEYLHTFQNISCPTTNEEESAFTDILQTLVLDRTAIPIEIARGVQAWKSEQHQEKVDLQEMHHALIRFFTARVGLRFLCEHHILTSPKRRLKRNELLGGAAQQQNKSDILLGCIETDCNVVQEIQYVMDQVTQQAKDCYGICPEMQILECTSKKGKRRNFTYVPHHLQYMVAELLKNASRATVQFHLKHGGTEKAPPPIRVVVARGEEDVTIKIADRGGGVPRSKFETIWSFAHSTADKDEESKTEFGTNAFTGATTHGFGLPLSKIYAKYFGGELTLETMEGYGTDAYLYLPRLGEACENLPQRVIVSPGAGVSHPSFLNNKTKNKHKNGEGSVRRFSSSTQPQES